MPKFIISETIHSEKVKTVRLADGTNTANTANMYTDAEVGKAVKLSAESRYVLAAAGDPIEGIITSINSGRLDDYTVGGIVSSGYKEVTFDGLEATPGTGTVALGDIVVCGTVVAKGTALTAPLKVCKATNQPGAAVVSTAAATNSTADIKTAVDAALVKVADAEANGLFAWKVVSLGSAGTGAVGTTGVVERVNV